MSNVASRRGTVGLLLAGMFALLPARAEAQAELTGTYIDYVGVRDNGIMINSANHSMRYRETVGGPYSCDVFYLGTPVHQFTVEATSTAMFRATNQYTGTDIPTTAGPTVAGRSITWSGRYENGADGVTVDLSYAYGLDDRAVIVTATLTNSGTAPLTDVYFMMNGDPDQGQCVSGSYNTFNDVVRQPPTDPATLATARVNTPGPFTLAVGSTDARARTHFNASGLPNEDASGTWAAPRDPGDTSQDVGMSIVFREAALAVGASTTFRFAYVWGSDAASIPPRFDVLGCAAAADGTACTDPVAGAGACRAGACCTGCWDGTACQAGDTVFACGATGGLCAGCVDGNSCTTDMCATGACTNPPVAAGTTCDDGLFCTADDTCDGAALCTGAARVCDDGFDCTTDACDEAADSCAAAVNNGFCLAGGGCVADGTVNPANTCEYCAATISNGSWTPAASGTTCEDGAFCTADDTCDGAGACTAGAARVCNDGLDCTTDSCDETADACAVVVAADTCAIEGACVAAGTAHPTDVCLGCVPGTSATSWSYLPGPTCDSDGDSVFDVVESPGGVPRDTDGDTIPDYLDADDDGDGIPTRTEVEDVAELGGDPDDDGVPAYLDLDSDDDGIPDSVEGTGDCDDDGIPNYLDPDVCDGDSDGDTVPDSVECPGGTDPCPDTDGDTVPDYLDPDDDGDGVPTATERPGDVDVDTDGDTVPDYLDPDDDGDGIPTATERPGDVDVDTDGDTVPDYLDPDDDGDGIPTATEREDVEDLGGDPDDDGIPAYLDTDSDGDGLLDHDEGTGDCDGDGIPNYLDPDVCDDGGEGGFAGGAGCGCRTSGGTGDGLAALGIFAGLALLIRRRRSRRDPEVK
jgi:MYXO-CTERM domain-containing protein